MKAKTKKRLIHLVTKKRLVSRKTSKRFLRTFLVGLATISVGSMAYAITLNKPDVSVTVNANGAGIKLEAPAPAAAPAANVSAPAQTGISSWYAFGLPEPDALTCASRTFPRGTYLRVVDLANGLDMTCLVNDYGPAIWTGRIIDLSRGSFEQLAPLGTGTIPVQISVAIPTTSEEDLPIFQQVYSATVGYNLCNNLHNAAYCDAHRQD